MGNKEKEAKLAEYRSNLGREFTLKFKKSVIERHFVDSCDVEDLYSIIAIPLRNAVRIMNTTTLSRIIEAHPHTSPNNDVTPLLLPRKGEHGLESLNFLAMSGRDYLEVIAMCAITCAIWDHLKSHEQLQVT